MRIVVFSAAVALALLASPTRASAHATLVRALPAAGSKVPASPTELRLTFSELVDVVSAKITGPGGRPVPTAPAQVDDAVVVIPLKAPLKRGVYRVNWEVMSTDGHKHGGRFSFEVGR